MLHFKVFLCYTTKFVKNLARLNKPKKILQNRHLFVFIETQISKYQSLTLSLSELVGELSCGKMWIGCFRK